MHSWKTYLEKGSQKTIRSVTVDGYAENIFRLLGWVQKRGELPLDTVTLDNLVPKVKLKYTLAEFRNSQNPLQEYSIAKVMAEEEAKEKAKVTIKILEDFFNNYSFNSSNRTRGQYIDSVISIAKYIYKDEAENSDDNEWDDVPVIMALRRFRKRFEYAAKTEVEPIPYESKSIPWVQLLEVLESLKHEADLIFRPKLKVNKNEKSCRQVKRPQTSVARDLQKFLMVAFFVVIPPRRCRVIAELSLGKTLLKGLKLPHKPFYPQEKIKKPNEAKWYIHLMPNDYKTGNIYGEVWLQIPNQKFKDGSCFYDYIDRWLNDYRPLFKPEHTSFFVMTKPSTKGNKIGHPTTTNRLSRIVQRGIMRFSGIPVSPKELRKMYVTYLRSLPDITPAQLQAAAASLGHSLEMQAKTYNQQTYEEKIAPIIDFQEKILRHHWGLDEMSS